MRVQPNSQSHTAQRLLLTFEMPKCKLHLVLQKPVCLFQPHEARREKATKQAGTTLLLSPLYKRPAGASLREISTAVCTDQGLGVLCKLESMSRVLPIAPCHAAPILPPPMTAAHALSTASLRRMTAGAQDGRLFHHNGHTRELPAYRA